MACSGTNERSAGARRQVKGSETILLAESELVGNPQECVGVVVKPMIRSQSGTLMRLMKNPAGFAPQLFVLASSFSRAIS
jgi:hypothetical protein